MSETLTFSIPGTPQAKARPRFAKVKGRMRTYDPQSEESRTLEWQFKARMKGTPLKGPLSVELHFYLPIPQSLSKKKKEAMVSGEIKHTKKCDIDNYVKAALDCMNGVVYVDDRQICELYATKEYCLNPRTEVVVKWLE